MSKTSFYWHETGHVAKLAFPIITAQMTRLLGSLIATFMVASLGNLALATVALGMTYYLCVFLFCNGVLFSTSIMIGKAFGSKNDGEISSFAMHGVWLAIIVGLPAMILMHFGYKIFAWCGQDPAVVAQAQPYLNALSWSVWPILIFLALQQFLLGISRPKMLNLLAVSGLIMTVALYYLLIFGHAGFPKLGVTGVGYAMSIGAWLNLALLIIYIWQNKATQKFRLAQHLFPVEWSRLKIMLKIGWPIGFTMVLEMMAGLILIFFIGMINVSALAAYQIVSQLSYLPLMVAVGIQQSAAIITSQHLGSNESHRIRDAAFVSTVLCVGLILLFSILFWIMPHQLAGIFLNHEQTVVPQTVYFAVVMLVIVGFSQLADGTRFVMTGILRGMHDVQKPLYISIFSFWLVALPLCAIAGFVFHWGAIGMWACFAIGPVLSAIILWARMMHKTSFFLKKID